MFTPSLQHIPLLQYLLCVQKPLVDLVVVSSDPWSPDFEYSTVADPGFPTKGAPTQWGDGSSYYLTKILPKKLHENERNWTERGRVSLATHWIRQCSRDSILILKPEVI